VSTSGHGAPPAWANLGRTFCAVHNRQPEGACQAVVGRLPGSTQASSLLFCFAALGIELKGLVLA
jgi:hypothetical protein